VPIVGIDARKYFDYGIGTYLQHLIGEIARIHRKFDGLLYVSPVDAGRIPTNRGWENIPVPFNKYSFSELIRFAPRLRRDAVDLFHEPHYTVPFNVSVPVVVTIHDLIHLQLPQYFSSLQKAYAHTIMRHAVSRADAIIATTEFTKRELLDVYPAARGKLHVIPLAVGEDFKPIGDSGIVQAFRKKFRLDKPFLFYAGSLKPHKNIPVLLKAFSLSSSRMHVDLAFAGERISENPELFRLLNDLKLGASVHDLGKLSPVDLITAFTAAECVVLPSEYEGFGLPVVEAMACGTPVIISDAPALVEVAGGAALVFERNNDQALSGAIDRLCADASMRHEYMARGITRSRQFSWAETARLTVSLYESFL
jgi:glycosyltransferase involved in cell wall biosynthesis